MVWVVKNKLPEWSLVAASHFREQAVSSAGCCRQSDALWNRCCRVGFGLFFWSQFAGFPAGCCCFLCNPVYSDFLLLLVTIWIHECKILEYRSPVFIFIFPMHNACLVHFHHCLRGRFRSSLTLPHSSSP